MARAGKVFFKCESCTREHRWRPHLAGKRAKCVCGRVMTVPTGPMVKPDSGKKQPDPIKSAKVPPPSGFWKWWYWAVIGGLIAGYCVYTTLFGAFSALTLVGLILAALAVGFGFWSRPTDTRS